MSPTPEGFETSSTTPPASAGSSPRAFLADGAALGASALLTAMVGRLGGLLAARLLDPDEVGRASAFVNGFVLIAGLAELGLGQAALKWLPSAGEHAPRMLTRVYTAVIAASVLLALVWGLVTRDNLAAQMGTGTLAAIALFVFASLAWTLFHVQDFVLTGLGLARWVPVENLSFGVVRVVLLVVLAKLFGALGIVLSWALPTMLAAVVVTGVLLTKAHRTAGVPGVVPTRARVVRLTGSIYVSTLGMTVMINLVPLILTARFGPAVGAVFFIIWNGVAAVELAAAGFGAALVVRLQGRSMTLLRGAVRQVLPLFTVPLVIAVLIAGPLLHLFGQAYADLGTGALRLVCLGLLLRLVGVLVVAIHLSRERTVRLVLINGGTAAAMVAAVSLLEPSNSLTLVGLSYFVIQAVAAALAVLDLWWCSRHEPDATTVPA